MTEKEIITALECCSTYGVSCTNCPAFVNVDRSNCRQVLKGAIDLINRQQAEIENLNELVVYNATCASKLQMKLVDVRAEAIKAFAEKVKANKNNLFNYIYSSRGFNEQIDNLVKEMVGDTK